MLAAVVVHSTAMAGLKNVCTHRRIAGPVITHGGNTTSASDNDSVCQDAARYGLARGHTCEKQCINIFFTKITSFFIQEFPENLNSAITQQSLSRSFRSGNSRTFSET